jgi:heme/copper-type cytochrome/quinol oxidase subunit 2
MTAQPPPPGYPPQPPAGQAPSSNLALAILATLFCFPITWIVAIVKAASVSGLWAQGLYAESQAAAKSARKWVIWSAIIWVIGVVVYLIIMVLAVNNGADTNAAMLATMF